MTTDKLKSKQNVRAKNEDKERLNRREAVEALMAAILGFFWLSFVFEPLALIFGIKIRKCSTDGATRKIALMAIIISCIAFELTIFEILYHIR